MSDPTVIQRLVANVARQIRLRRVEFYGLRGLFWGAVAAVVPLLLKETLGPWSYALAGLLLLAGAAAGAAWGLLLSLPPAEAARLADRGYGLQERISTALEWADRRDRTPIVDALVTDAAARAGQVSGHELVDVEALLCRERSAGNPKRPGRTRSDGRVSDSPVQ